MSVRDEVDIKYWFPKLNFNVRPNNNQKYVVKYTLYNENYENGNWITVNSACEINPDGEPLKRLEIKGLRPFTEYVIRFTDTRNNNYDFKFKTGKNVAMSDSPYYNKTLFPGQIYDWYEEGLNTIGQPNENDCSFCYWLNAKKREMLFDEEWGSMSFIKDVNGKYTHTSEDGNFDTKKDINGTSILAFSPNRWNGTADEMLALPNLKYNDEKNKYEAFSAYWTDAGGGGVSLDDVLMHKMALGFSFYIDEDCNSDQVLCCFDTKKDDVEKLEVNYYFSLIVNHATKTLRVKSGTYDSDINNDDIDTNVLEYNKWYCAFLYKNYITVYSMDVDDTNVSYPSFKFEFTEVNVPAGDVPNNTGKCAFYFGGPNTDKIGIAYILCPWKINAEEPIYQKILNPDIYQCRLRLSGTNKNGITWKYLQPVKLNAVVETKKASFLIDPDICKNVPELINHSYTETGDIKAEIVSNEKTLFTKYFKGFDFPITETGETVHVGGLIPNNSYLQDSFDIDFTTASDPIKALQEYFFTKHGTWGGYNGGVNGHNIYFDENKNLILENHGDYYTGSLIGVGKESDVEPYCGYGGNVNYDNNAWDRRTNKARLRTGTALVSNKYFGYGKIDVWLQLPVGTWGVCPAIWLFHYIEVSDTDYRYDIAPYNERNEQGSDEAGWYRVVNNEIDIELPSHLTNGTINDWSDLQKSYFDTTCIDNQLAIGVVAGSDDDKGLYQLVDIDNPKERISWKKIYYVANPRYIPSFQNCKLNNWVGELNSGDGWCLPQGSVSAEDYYKGTSLNGDNDLVNAKEEYCSRLTHIADNENGFADGKFHKWSIVWLPDRVLLYVDDIFYRENKGFIPFNQMKLTIAGWFPTMPADRKKEPRGVVDRDGIHGNKGALIGSIDDNENTSIGTWAGTVANFDVLHMKVSRVKYEKYHAGETITINGTSTKIESEPSSLGESFPESGLRMFVE